MTDKNKFEEIQETGRSAQAEQKATMPDPNENLARAEKDALDKFPPSDAPTEKKTGYMLNMVANRQSTVDMLAGLTLAKELFSTAPKDQTEVRAYLFGVITTLLHSIGATKAPPEAYALFFATPCKTPGCEGCKDWEKDRLGKPARIAANEAMAALVTDMIGMGAKKISPEELEAIQQMIYHRTPKGKKE